MRQVTSPDRAGLSDGGNAPDAARATSPALFPRVEPIRLASTRPILCVVVDAEEEFDWDRPVSARNNATGSIHHQKRAHDIFSCYGVKPTYLVTYPIASDPSASAVLREYLADGRCDIGAQLHPWVTPPFDGETEERLSFPGNLPPRWRREKIRRLSGAIRDSFGLQPTAYKAGRYGLGPATAALLEDEGFLVDTSLIPRTSLRRGGRTGFFRFRLRPVLVRRTPAPAGTAGHPSADRAAVPAHAVALRHGGASADPLCPGRRLAGARAAAGADHAVAGRVRPAGDVPADAGRCWSAASGS